MKYYAAWLSVFWAGLCAVSFAGSIILGRPVDAVLVLIFGLPGLWGYGYLRETQADGARSIEVHRALRELTAALERVQPEVAPTINIMSGLKVAEVTRRPDTALELSINGWLSHRFGLSAWAVAGRSGNFGAGLAQAAGGGHSTIRMRASGTLRPDLVGDGFVAIFEHPQNGGSVDTLRAVAPSESAAREIVAAHVGSAGASPAGSATRAALVAGGEMIAAAVPISVSYIADRLGALARMPGDVRTTVSLAGIPIDAHTLLAAAVRFGDGEPWHVAFPAAALSAADEALKRST